ncbi:MAG: ATP-dependent RNA helicase HrpA, partial [Thiohalomonadales bacterium]
MNKSNKKQSFASIKQQTSRGLLRQYLLQLGLAEDHPFMTKDFGKIQKLLQHCQSEARGPNASEKSIKRLEDALNRSNSIFNLRLSSCPQPTYAAILPISDRVTEIRDAIIAHPVVVVAGDTGSGKSTQLPKICLQAGRGIKGYIGHTQPRRIAARSIAERISEELQTELGGVVGYKVRFSDQTRPESLIKLMTDGILLAELQRDRYLAEYDTIIIDEAHERSLNIDFLLGYLSKLVDIRSDLKIIITSATIDTEKFAKHFNDAPIISVEGRTYPVEVRYSELKTDDKEDVSHVVRRTVESIVKTQEKGDILVFLSGEAEIKRCADVINKRQISNTLVLPLYSRLAYQSQYAIFKATAQRKVILATNIAETSLTIPGIKYVIDPGYARISRYNFRRKVQRLPIEKISQASANQRKGRCGRVSNGVCYRLYSQDDFEQREEFTDPEIRRTNLAAVILQLEASRLGDVRTFPFIDPPEPHFINDGYKLLFELAAVDESHKLTSVGRQLARYPVDPRLAKMLLAAGQEDCLYEIVVIVSALSIQDIRETSIDKVNKAELAHQVFSDKNSDFLFYLNVWQAIKSFKMGDLRRFCKQHYFSFLRMIEWRDIVKQLHSVIKEMSISVKPREELASYNQIHRAILPGLITLIGLKNDDGSYKAPRNSNFLISHRSCMHKKRTTWIMAESLVHTRKLYANNVAKIYPKWIEQMAAHLIKKSYYDIDWDDKRGRVIAYESTELYGLTIQARRRVDYGKQDAIASRPIFIQKALVERQLKAPLDFIKFNNSLLQRFEILEEKFRTRNIVVSDARLLELYQQ